MRATSRRLAAIVSAVVLAGLVILSTPGTGAAAGEETRSQTVVDVPLDELITAGERWDGRLIRVTGELIGDYGRRFTGYVWTQLNQDSYVYAPVQAGGPLSGGNSGIGIRIPDELAVDLDPPGGYRRRGPVVEAVGIWRDHSPSHGGESFLDVTALRVEVAGRVLPEDPHTGVLIAGIVALAVAAELGRRVWKLRREE